jgi:hypothetical protein
MHANWATKVPFDPGDVLDVVDMAVGEKEKLKLDFLLNQPVASSVGRVEKYPTFRRLQSVTICLKNAAGEASVRDHILLLFLLPLILLLSHPAGFEVRSGAKQAKKKV